MPTKQSKSQVITFVKERETKNTVRFAEQTTDDATPVVGTLYVQNDALSALGNPDSLSVTIAAGA
jgi:hypothetical protein